MPRRMELDLVDAVSVAIVRLQPWRVLVRFDGLAPNFGTAGKRSDRPQPLPGPLSPLALDRLDQRPVGLEGVVFDQRRWLVGDFVRSLATSLERGHLGDLSRATRSSKREHPFSRI